MPLSISSGPFKNFYSHKSGRSKRHLQDLKTSAKVNTGGLLPWEVENVEPDSDLNVQSGKTKSRKHTKNKSTYIYDRNANKHTYGAAMPLKTSYRTLGDSGKAVGSSLYDWSDDSEQHKSSVSDLQIADRFSKCKPTKSKSIEQRTEVQVKIPTLKIKLPTISDRFATISKKSSRPTHEKATKNATISVHKNKGFDSKPSVFSKTNSTSQSSSTRDAVVFKEAEKQRTESPIESVYDFDDEFDIAPSVDTFQSICRPKENVISEELNEDDYGIGDGDTGVMEETILVSDRFGNKKKLTPIRPVAPGTEPVAPDMGPANDHCEDVTDDKLTKKKKKKKKKLDKDDEQNILPNSAEMKQKHDTKHMVADKCMKKKNTPETEHASISEIVGHKRVACVDLTESDHESGKTDTFTIISKRVPCVEVDLTDSDHECGQTTSIVEPVMDRFVGREKKPVISDDLKEPDCNRPTSGTDEIMPDRFKTKKKHKIAVQHKSTLLSDSTDEISELTCSAGTVDSAVSNSKSTYEYNHNDEIPVSEELLDRFARRKKGKQHVHRLDRDVDTKPQTNTKKDEAAASDRFAVQHVKNTSSAAANKVKNTGNATEFQKGKESVVIKDRFGKNEDLQKDNRIEQKQNVTDGGKEQAAVVSDRFSKRNRKRDKQRVVEADANSPNKIAKTAIPINVQGTSKDEDTKSDTLETYNYQLKTPEHPTGLLVKVNVVSPRAKRKIELIGLSTGNSSIDDEGDEFGFSDIPTYEELEQDVITVNNKQNAGLIYLKDEKVPPSESICTAIDSSSQDTGLQSYSSTELSSSQTLSQASSSTIDTLPLSQGSITMKELVSPSCRLDKFVTESIMLEDASKPAQYEQAPELKRSNTADSVGVVSPFKSMSVSNSNISSPNKRFFKRDGAKASTSSKPSSKSSLRGSGYFRSSSPTASNDDGFESMDFDEFSNDKDPDKQFPFPVKEIDKRIKVPREHKPLYTLVHNVRQAHEVLEVGELEEFQDDIRYLIECLEGGSSSIRCLSIIGLAEKSISPLFRVNLRAENVLPDIYTALRNSSDDPSTALCTAMFLYILSCDRLRVEFTRESLDLIVKLLDCDESVLDSNYDKNLCKVKKMGEVLCKSDTHCHLKIDEMSPSYLAMETLLSLTSSKAGESLKDTLRDSHGIDRIVDTVHHCTCDMQKLAGSSSSGGGCRLALSTDRVILLLTKIGRCLNVLENITTHGAYEAHKSKVNQKYLVQYADGTLVKSLAHTLQTCNIFFADVDAIKSEEPNALVREACKCIIASVKVLHNVTHQSETACQLIGDLGIIEYLLPWIMVNVVKLPAANQFDFRIVALDFIMNAVSHCRKNQSYLTGQLCLVPHECQRTSGRATKLETMKNALLCLARLFTVKEQIASEKSELPEPEKLKEDDSFSKGEADDGDSGEQHELSISEAVNKAGEHMQETMEAGYCAFLLGYLLTTNTSHIKGVLPHLPKQGFKLMAAVLKKLLTFMKMVSDFEETEGGIKYKKVISFLEQL